MACGLLGGAFFAACGQGSSNEGGAPPQEAPEVSVVTVAPTSVPIEDVLPGRVSPVRVAEVRPQVGGIIRARLFAEGETVKIGQPLYHIDPSVFRAEVAGAQATLARQKAALEFATREAERAQQLATSGTIAPQNAEAAENARAVAQAEVALSQATLQRSQLNLRYAVVTAPIAGRIGISRVTEGALVSPSDPTSLATIQQIDEVYVDIKQPASRYEELREAFSRGELVENDALTVTLLSMRGAPYEAQGKLLFTDISVDPTTSELTLRVLVPNADLRLLPGMFVRASIAFGRDPDAILVPQQAVRHDPAFGEGVLIVDASNAVAARPVVTGRVVGGQQIVRRGLTAGDRVIVEGYDRVGSGMTVRPAPWSPTSPPASATPPPAAPAPASAP